MLLNQTVILVVLGVIFFWLVFLSFLFFRFYRHYQKLTKGITKKDLRSILDKLLTDFNKESKKVNLILKELERIKKDENYFIQKIGLVRYNPFAETGGNQSFCLSFLDGNDSGLVISSLHSRDATRVYAKPVKKAAAAGYELSSEEKMAVKKAKRIK